MRVANVAPDSLGGRRVEHGTQIVPMVIQPPHYKVALRSPICWAHVADHFARQHRAIGPDHGQPPTGETSTTWPGMLRRTHDAVHAAIEQREEARQSRRMTVRRGYTGTEESICSLVEAGERRICGRAAQPRQFQLIEPVTTQVVHHGGQRIDIA